MFHAHISVMPWRRRRTLIGIALLLALIVPVVGYLDRSDRRCTE
jgi:hypothetical protein